MTETTDLPTSAPLRAQDPATSPGAGLSSAACSSGEAAPGIDPAVLPPSPSVEEEHDASSPASLLAAGEQGARPPLSTSITTLKPEHLQELLSSSTPGPWAYFPKRKYNEHHVSVPLGDGSQMSLGLFPDGVPTAHPEADGQLIALAPELAQGYVELHAAVPTPAQVAEVEGLRAALGGCAGTHNPHVFGDPVLREAWARGLRQVHAYRDRELEIQVGRGLHPMATELAQVLGLLAGLARAHQESVQFLRLLGGRDARDDYQRVLGQLGELDAAHLEGLATRVLASLPLLPVPEASGGAEEVSRHDTPERILYESVVLDEDTGLPLAEIEVLSRPGGRRVVDVVLLGAEVVDLAEDQREADVGQGFSAGTARAFGRQLLAAAEVAGT